MALKLAALKVALTVSLMAVYWAVHLDYYLAVMLVLMTAR